MQTALTFSLLTAATSDILITPNNDRKVKRRESQRPKIKTLLAFEKERLVKKKKKEVSHN